MKLFIVIVVVCAAVSVTIAQSANEALFEAARAGDVARIEAALAQGAGINATSRYNVTPLIFAASNGRLEAVKVLVARGANVNAEDSFYRSTAAAMAVGNGHVDVAVFLLQNGWDGGDYLTLFGVQSDNATLVKTALTSKVTHRGVQAAFAAAERMKRTALIPILKAALSELPAEPAAPHVCRGSGDPGPLHGNVPGRRGWHDDNRQLPGRLAHGSSAGATVLSSHPIGSRGVPCTGGERDAHVQRARRTDGIDTACPGSGNDRARAR